MTTTVSQLLQQAIAAHNRKDFQKAEKLYRAVLKLYPKQPDANHNLGLLALAVNKPALALPFFKTAVSSNYSMEKYWLSYITALIKDRQLEKAKKLIRQGSKKAATQTRFHEAYNRLGLGLKAAGNLRDAEIALRKAISLMPSFHIAHINLGNTLIELGRAKDAVTCFKQATSLKPDFATTHFNLANTFQILGKFEQAVASYKQAIGLNPDHFEAYNNLGFTLSNLQRPEEAESCYKSAIALNPDYSEAYLNLGNLHYGMERLKEAVESYQKAIETKPNYAEPYLNLCELFEKTNRLDDVLKIAENGKGKVSDREDEFLFFEASILFRQECYERAGSIISKINLAALSNQRKTAFLKLKADWLHHQKDFDGAFNTFLAMNQNAKNSAKYRNSQPDQYYDSQKENVCELARLQNSSSFKGKIQTESFQPTFLIGFPRSGTTLLDTILRSHSKIEVIEEQPMVWAMSEKLGYSKSVSDIENIDEDLVMSLRQVYINELAKHVDLSGKSLVIDKLPLNILSIPLIKKVFPNAKFILVLRHPLDCILSCWMQNFNLNPAMANMVELNRIVDFYCIVMEMLKLCEQRYQMNICTIRYEDLVVNFDENISNLLAFFDLSWEREVKDYQKTALSRAKVNTPSYSQVVKPIYDSASYRWKKYEKQLLTYKPKLSFWAQSFGYDL